MTSRRTSEQSQEWAEHQKSYRHAICEPYLTLKLYEWKLRHGNNFLRSVPCSDAVINWNIFRETNVNDGFRKESERWFVLWE